jgi:RNA-directed DNA polymerase
VLHDAARRGPVAADREGHADFRAHLEGRISWVTAANPARGPKLRAALDAIDWG